MFISFVPYVNNFLYYFSLYIFLGIGVGVGIIFYKYFLSELLTLFYLIVFSPVDKRLSFKEDLYLIYF